jgi:hypothetical protein
MKLLQGIFAYYCAALRRTVTRMVYRRKPF